MAFTSRRDAARRRVCRTYGARGVCAFADPALTRWANLCRTYGAQEPISNLKLESSEKQRENESGDAWPSHREGMRPGGVCVAPTRCSAAGRTCGARGLCTFAYPTLTRWANLCRTYGAQEPISNLKLEISAGTQGFRAWANLWRTYGARGCDPPSALGADFKFEIGNFRVERVSRLPCGTRVDRGDFFSSSAVGVAEVSPVREDWES